MPRRSPAGRDGRAHSSGIERPGHANARASERRDNPLSSEGDLATRQRIDHLEPRAPGSADMAERVFTAALEAAIAPPLHCMPEIFCRFERARTGRTRPCPTRRLLAPGVGSRDGSSPARRIARTARRCAAPDGSFRSPRLLPEVAWLRIDRWRVGREHCEFAFHRYGTDVALTVGRSRGRRRDSG
jgi:hypothetical protein